MTSLGCRLWRPLDVRRGPSLAGEDRRHGESLEPWLYGVQFRIEEHEQHGCLLVRQRIRLAIQREPFLIVRLPARSGNHAVKRSVAEERYVATNAAVVAVQQGIEKILGVRIIGVPVLEGDVGLAVPRRFAHRRRVALNDLDADADLREVCLDRLRDARELLALRRPQLYVDSVGITGVLEQRTCTRRVVRIRSERWIET